jgi:protein involved in polysaccharide export with SLBB domain
MNLKSIIFIFFAFAALQSGLTQSAQEAAVRQELKKQGVDEDEVRKRLLEKGYDPDNVDIDNPNEILEFQRVSEEIIAEIKSEQKAAVQIVSDEKIDTTDIGAAKGAATTSAVETLVSVSPSSDAAKVVVDNQNVNPAKIYGQHIYRDGAIRYYKENEFINPPSNYILGPGDRVTVSIWGQAEENFSQEISNGGFVKFSQIPRITLGGLKLEDAKKLMKTKLARYYPFREEDFELKVTSTRNINIFITGEVGNVGSYNISAINPAVNALAAAGGPSDIGSVRNIQIVSSKGNRSLDLYAFLRDPQLSKGLFLNEGDYILVPILGKVVTINGAIRRPYKYELKDTESLSDLIDFAGGLGVDAYKKNIKITRYENDTKVILNVDLTNPSQVSNFRLSDGDVIDIMSIDETIKNAVNVEGALYNSGSFAIKSGMKISDLVPLLELKEDAILDIAYLLKQNDDQTTVRWNLVNLNEVLNDKSSPNNLLLENDDRLIIRSKSLFVTSNTIEVRGAVNNEATYQFDESGNLKLSDAIFLAGGLSPQATDFAYLIRNIPGSTSPEYISVNIKEAVGNPSSAANVSLEPNDKLQVYSKGEYVDETFIKVEGAVRAPNTYRYDESLTLYDAIQLSKGLTIDAAYNNIDIFRLEFKDINKTRTLIANVSIDKDLNILGSDIKLQPFDHIVVRQAAEFELQREVYVSGEVKYPGKYFILNDNFKIVDLINEAGGLTDEAFVNGATLQRNQDGLGYVVLDLQKAMDSPNSKSNVILQLTDKINIPKMSNLVTVQGAVNTSDAVNTMDNPNSNINFVYEGKRNVMHYIERSGGLKSNADKSSIAVIYPNGEVKRTKNILFFRKHPKVTAGSKIVVDAKPPKLNAEGSPKKDIDWGEVLADSIGQATAILSLLLLIDRID